MPAIRRKDELLIQLNVMERAHTVRLQMRAEF
jgi:hypothetical protein